MRHYQAALFVLIVILGLASGCRTLGPEETTSEQSADTDPPTRETDSLAETARLRHPTLDATLWAQTAVEYGGVTRTAYRAASVMMKNALRDSSWTAALVQAQKAPSSYRDKPPAVVLDVDETVLDNSPYQARLIKNDDFYSAESWNDWCRERKATAVPGAHEFAVQADSMGVQVIYLTNRDAKVETATRENLRQKGFPVEDAPDAVLTQGEKPGWEPKAPRRAWVAERYRILLLVGDNVGDFITQPDTTLAARDKAADRYQQFWGTRWIVLPNPQYGSWESALIDHDYSLSPTEQLRRKRDHLQTEHGDS